MKMRTLLDLLYRVVNGTRTVLIYILKTTCTDVLDFCHPSGLELWELQKADVSNI